MLPNCWRSKGTFAGNDYCSDRIVCDPRAVHHRNVIVGIVGGDQTSLLPRIDGSNCQIAWTAGDQSELLPPMIECFDRLRPKRTMAGTQKIKCSAWLGPRRTRRTMANREAQDSGLSTHLHGRKRPKERQMRLRLQTFWNTAMLTTMLTRSRQN